MIAGWIEIERERHGNAIADFGRVRGCRGIFLCSHQLCPGGGDYRNDRRHRQCGRQRRWWAGAGNQCGSAVQNANWPRRRFVFCRVRHASGAAARFEIGPDHQHRRHGQTRLLRRRRAGHKSHDERTARIGDRPSGKYVRDRHAKSSRAQDRRQEPQHQHFRRQRQSRLLWRRRTGHASAIQRTPQFVPRRDRRPPFAVRGRCDEQPRSLCRFEIGQHHNGGRQRRSKNADRWRGSDRFSTARTARHRFRQRFALDRHA